MFVMEITTKHFFKISRMTAKHAYGFTKKEGHMNVVSILPIYPIEANSVGLKFGPGLLFQTLNYNNLPMILIINHNDNNNCQPLHVPIHQFVFFNNLFDSVYTIR